MNRELGILLRNSHPNDFMFCVPLNFDSPQLVVCKMEAPDSSKMLLRAAYKFGHLVKLRDQNEFVNFRNYLLNLIQNIIFRLRAFGVEIFSLIKKVLQKKQ
jgi:hypothetical protein